MACRVRPIPRIVKDLARIHPQAGQVPGTLLGLSSHPARRVIVRFSRGRCNPSSFDPPIRTGGKGGSNLSPDRAAPHPTAKRSPPCAESCPERPISSQPWVRVPPIPSEAVERLLRAPRGEAMVPYQVLDDRAKLAPDHSEGAGRAGMAGRRPGPPGRSFWRQTVTCLQCFPLPGGFLLWTGQAPAPSPSPSPGKGAGGLGGRVSCSGTRAGIPSPGGWKGGFSTLAPSPTTGLKKTTG